jgi:hypothetical protein
MFFIATKTAAFVIWGILGLAITKGTWFAFGWLNKKTVGSRFWVVLSGVSFIAASALGKFSSGIKARVRS